MAPAAPGDGWEGTRALVTGGASGIGREVARLLAEAGARVAVLDLDTGSSPTPPGELALHCDVSAEDDVVRAVGRAEEALGGLDLAVLNAGVGGFSFLADMAAEEWDRVLSVNLRGVFLCLREVARAMMAAGRPGSVVVTSSTSGRLVEPGMGHYNVSKAGVDQLVRVAARELGSSGIRVNAVAPGATATPLFAPTGELPGYWERLEARTPLGGVGEASEVARAVLAVAGLAWVTGQSLVADGGISLWSPIDPTEGTALGRDH